MARETILLGRKKSQSFSLFIVRPLFGILISRFHKSRSTRIFYCVLLAKTQKNKKNHIFNTKSIRKLEDLHNTMTI